MMTRCDERILAFIQDWIADPLQFSGVDLERQLRGTHVIILLGYIAGAVVDVASGKWVMLFIHFAGTTLFLYLVIWSPSDHSIARVIANRTRTWEGLFWLWVGITMLIPPVHPVDIAASVISLGFLLRHYLARCEPKPPARELQHASDMG